MFVPFGAYVLCDGQYGSTGKGAFAAFLAQMAVEHQHMDHFAGSLSSNGPNSGHTSYFRGDKIVLKQLPTFGVHAHLMGHTIPIFLTAGAVINPVILAEEARKFPDIPIEIHPNAAFITSEDIWTEQSGSIRDIASTQSGTGAAISRKVLRKPTAIVGGNDWARFDWPDNVNVRDFTRELSLKSSIYFVEVAQGFSLGINSKFYPHCTSRECTVMQAIADARIPPRFVTHTYMCVRSYAIRVGNLGNHSSGDWYDDQLETNWATIGVEPELTTVTKRIRRVASFSWEQFREALRANDPDTIFVSHMDYFGDDERNLFADKLAEELDHFDKEVKVYFGYGPETTDIRRME